LIGGNAQGGSDVFLHLWRVLHDLGGFGDESAVDVLDDRAFFSSQGGTFFENAERADAFDTGIAGGEVEADVRQAECAEHGIGDGVAKHIRIAMALQAAAVGNLDPAKDEGSAFLERMHVIADANTIHEMAG